MFSIAIFASGKGSNAQKLIDHFRNHAQIRVVLVVCNKPEAGVLRIAREENIPSWLIEKEKFFRGDAYVPELKSLGIDLLVLAGFLWKIPDRLVQAFRGRILNIHPALLPRFGGKGMYGQHVHEAVLAQGEKESGISIHYVDEHYDHGDLVFQARCPIEPGETPESLSQKVHILEHRHYPWVVEEVANQLIRR